MIGIDEKEIQYYARHRVEGKGNINYRTLPMSSDEQHARRMFVRRALSGTRFANCSNDYLDGMRVEIEEGGGMWIEDVDGYLYFNRSPKVLSGEADFRKERAKIPKEYSDLYAKDFDWSCYADEPESVIKAKDIVNKFITKQEELRNKGMGLYIYSTTKGSGKTMLACCILNEISKRYIGSVKFVNALDFLEMTKKGFNYDNPDVEALYICKTLVIDDIGVQMDKEWVNTVFYRLINDRYNNNKITIYTSNVAVSDLKMDDRIIDRIDSTSFSIHLPEISVRRMKFQTEKEKILNGAN